MACEVAPMSRTYQYRKVMKPMLERKRRARINKSLEELKDLMVNALQNEGENVAKMEKADILEVTVNHLKRLDQRGQLSIKSVPTNQEKYREGYTHCASEVSRCLASIEGVDVHLGTKLMTHLGLKLTEHEKRAPLSIVVPQSGPSPAFSTTSSGYSSPSELSPTPSTSSCSSGGSSPLPAHHNGLLTFAPVTPQLEPQNLSVTNVAVPIKQEGLLVMSSPQAAQSPMNLSKSMWRPW